MKKSACILFGAVALTAIVADATLGGTAPLAASGTKRRVSATVSTTTAIVSEPVVEAKNTTTNVWEPAPLDTGATAVRKGVEEPYRPAIAAATSMLFDCNNNGQLDTVEIANGAPDTDSDAVLDSCEYAIGDLNLNGLIDQQDLSILLGWWGIPNPQFGDLNNDGAVNALDLGIILGRFGVVVY